MPTGHCRRPYPLRDASIGANDKWPKLLIAGLAWLVAAVAMRGGRPARGAILCAAVTTLAVFMIPHSVWGSQIDWSAVPHPPATPN